MAVTEPPGDFDYLWEDLGQTDYDGVDDDDFDDYDFDEPYQPPARPAPWYRTTAALLAICAIMGGVVAIVVSAVLLMSRTSRSPARDVIPTIAPTPSSAPATAPPMIATVPVSPTPTPAPSQSTASVPVVIAPTHEPSVEPTLGGTSTPVTRSPLSVRPEPHPAFPHY